MRLNLHRARTDIIEGRLGLTMVEVLQNFIDGQFVPCSRHIDSYNPATGEVHLKIPDSDKEDVEKAVDAANKAFIKYTLAWIIF